MAAKRPGTATKRSLQRKTNGKASSDLLNLTLSISERYALIRLLPDFGSIEEVTDIGYITEALSLDTAERIMWGVREEAGQIFWSVDGEAKILFSLDQWKVIINGALYLNQRKTFPAGPVFLKTYLLVKALVEEQE